MGTVVSGMFRVVCCARAQRLVRSPTTALSLLRFVARRSCSSKSDEEKSAAQKPCAAASKPLGIAQRLKHTVVEYGTIATAFHMSVRNSTAFQMSVWMSSWLGVHMAVMYGCDVGSALQQIPMVG